jgi:hypothetical protein
MELSVNYTWIWLVITEPQEIPFQLSELQFLIRKMISEDLNLTCSDRTTSNSLLSGQFLEPAIKDTDLFSKPQNQEHSDNDVLII